MTKRFGRRAIVDLSLRVQRGDRLGLIVTNGAGKSTLIKLILGQLEADGARFVSARTRKSRTSINCASSRSGNT